MLRRVRLGVLVPSSNTVLEPLTHDIISCLHDDQLVVSVHFSRFRVKVIDISTDATAQFELGTIVAAAELLADAKVDVIGWSGTSAGWLGFEVDERLCAAIEARTGIKATTSTLALNRLLHKFGVQRLGLVTPYVQELNSAIRDNYRRIGIEIDESQERNLGIIDNNKIAQVDESTLDRMVNEVVKNGATAVSTFCTNLRAAQLVENWEQQHGIMVFDTVSTVVWDMLRMVDVEPSLVTGWGKMFSNG